jgi:diaminohydroxyphosphoribosylaminopyrimidine deaminase/5-amino-6-(5-phosphoribosylamino)uracil reductase
MSRNFDERMMAFALRLAERGRPSPNPHVGAVIVRDGQVLATGFHLRAGQAHAEVDALEKIGYAAEGATMYVTLEPCNHHGRTGPCSEAVLRAGITRVVVGCEDRIPGHGGGADTLRARGVEVVMGVLRHEAERTVADFEKHALRGLPYVTLKAAVTLDGRMAARTGDSRWVTGEEARKHAHRLRDQSDAVLVGVGTVLADDPELTVRHVNGRDPLRVVLDSDLRTPPNSRLFNGSSRATTLIFHASDASSASAERASILRARGAVLCNVPRSLHGLDLNAVLRELARRDVVRLLVEGGPRVHGALIDGGHVDAAAVFVAPRILGDASALPLAVGGPRASMAEALRIVSPRVRNFGDDLFIEGVLEAGAQVAHVEAHVGAGEPPAQEAG